MKELAAVGVVAALLFAAVAGVVYLTYDMTPAERCLAYGKCSLLPAQ